MNPSRKVEIDPHSGFCTGVVNAIRKAEDELRRGSLYCIGDIVHNQLEMERLERKGLHTIDHATFASLHDCRVLFRAHGEPLSSYRQAQQNGVEVIDASCPVVLNLQKRIREAYEETGRNGGQIVIYGKQGHAEVVGLVGQTEGTAIVVDAEGDLERVDFTRPIVLFSQTTKSLDGFHRIVTLMQERQRGGLVVHDTICRMVANRIPQLINFAKKHDVIIFVSGEKSSNGRQLYAVCKESNERTFFVKDVADVREEMFENAESVGISGATSTPLWVMEGVKKAIETDCVTA